MQHISSWRDLLETILGDPAERERIAAELGVRTITLTRWGNGTSTPHPDTLRRLPRAVPEQYRHQFRELLEQSFPALAFAPAEDEDLQEEVPVALVGEVLRTRATCPDTLRFWTITRQVLQHAILQLDPEPVGMELSVVQCMPPSSDGKIRSLRESFGLGTGPWVSALNPKALFLGADSLAGHVTASGHFEQIGDLRITVGYLPAYRTAHEVSAAAQPITYAGRVAGCLLFASTQPNYFSSQARQRLIQRYADLLALAFEPEEFYPPDMLVLNLVPPLEVQQSYLGSFRQRVANIMTETARMPHPASLPQAERMAWQEIEELLLQLAAERPQHITKP